MTKARTLIAAIVATIAIGLSSFGIASAASSSWSPGAHNTLMSGYVDNGGARCDFQYQYGNAFGVVAYAKIKLTSSGCKGASVYMVGTLNGACCGAASDDSPDSNGWIEAQLSNPSNIVEAQFAIANNTGGLLCLTYNALTNARTRNVVLNWNTQTC